MDDATGLAEALLGDRRIRGACRGRDLLGGDRDR